MLDGFSRSRRDHPVDDIVGEGNHGQRAGVGFSHVVLRRVDRSTDAAIEEVHEGDVADDFPSFLFALVGLLVAHWDGMGMR